MKEKISVIIPTHKATDALDLCIRSLIEGQQNKNEIIIVVDGTYDINKEVLDKWKDHISILNLEQNVGTCRATNLGVYNSSNERILIINDDNVAPKDWDIILNLYYSEDRVVSPNQIEPFRSIFSQFIIKDFGRDPKTFDLENFQEKSKQISEKHSFTWDSSGGLFPIFMNKQQYLSIGGFDESYPSPSGFVADVEFFFKCQLKGLKMWRIYGLHFYHFVSLSAKTPEQVAQAQQYELNCWEYFKYKWGNYAYRDENNHIHLTTS